MIGIDDGRQAAAIEAIEQPRFIKFRRHERMKAADPCPPAEKIRTAPLELSGAAPSQNHAQLLVAFDQELNLIEKGGKFLHLVDDDNPLLGAERLSEVLRTSGELAECVGFQQIVDGGLGKRPPDQRALAGLAGAEEEHGLVPDDLAEVENPCVHISISIAYLHEIQQVQCRIVALVGADPIVTPATSVSAI